MKIVPVSEIPGKSVVQDCPTTTRRLSSMSVYKTCLEMKEVCELEKGIGLSAVQVGLPWRLFIVKEEDGEYSFLVDCEYESVSVDSTGVRDYTGNLRGGSLELSQTPIKKSIEGCLSLKTSNGELRRFLVERPDKVRIMGKKLLIGDDGKPLFEPINIILDGLYSIVYQHEIDHQNGILISDIGEETGIW